MVKDAGMETRIEAGIQITVMNVKIQRLVTAMTDGVQL